MDRSLWTLDPRGRTLPSAAYLDEMHKTGRAVPYTLRLVIPELPKLQADVMQKWARVSYRKRWHRLVGDHAMVEGLPQKPLTAASIVGVRYCCGVQPDRINVWSSFKAPIDGLIHAGVIEDDNPTILCGGEDYLAVRVPTRREQRIEITVVEVAAPG